MIINSVSFFIIIIIKRKTYKRLVINNLLYIINFQYLCEVNDLKFYKN